MAKKLTFRHLEIIDKNLKKLGINEWYLNKTIYSSKQPTPLFIYLKNIPYDTLRNLSLYSFFAKFRVEEKIKIKIFDCNKNVEAYKKLKEKGDLISNEEIRETIVKALEKSKKNTKN